MFRYNVIWPSQGFACVTVCSLNCLNQFLKYKIGYTCGVCVCVCACALHIFVERWFWELKKLTGSLFELYAWLHSYLCFSLLEKWFLSYFDTSSIPPRHLAICRALKLCSYRNLDRSSTTRWIDRESSWTFDSFSTHGGSIKPHLLCLMFLYLNTCIYRWQNPRHLARHLYLSRITEALYIGLSQSGSHFLNLSRSIHSYSPPKHFLLPLNLQLTWFSAFPCFKSLGICSCSLIFHAFHAFRPRFWGFWNFLGFFKIDELLLKFWDEFMIKWV